MARLHRRANLVFDPYAPVIGQNISGWNNSYVVNTFERLHACFWANRSMAVFLDECSQIFRKGLRFKGQPQVDVACDMLTQGRHINWQTGGGGHTVFMIAQRFTQLDKTARDMASKAYIFRVDVKDAKALAEQFGIAELENAHKLPPLHYYIADSTGDLERGKLTFS